jgi:hypothetical protein
VTDEPVQLPMEAMTGWTLTGGAEGAGRAAKHRLVAEVRRLIAASVVTAASDTHAKSVDAVADAIAAAVRQLDAVPHFPAGASEAGGDDARLLERSGITGSSNPLAAPVHLWHDGEVVRGAGVFGWAYEGPPGCVHGGFVAAAFDDLLGAAQTLTGYAGFTGRLTVHMRAPTPLNARIDYEGGVSRLDGRKIWTWGTAKHGELLLAEAEGLFIMPKGGMLDDERIARITPRSLRDDALPPASPGS